MPKPREPQKPKLAKYAPLVSAALAISLAALPALGEARERAPVKCSASVHSGSMSAYASHSGRTLVINAPIVKASRYLSVSLPESYTAAVVRAACSRPEAERGGFIADILQNNAQIAYSLLGSKGGVTFSCAAVDGSLPSSATAPLASARIAAPGPSASVQSSSPSSASGPALPGPALQPPAKALRGEELQVRGGSGTSSSPFQVVLRKGRSRRNDLSGQMLELPISFDVGKRVYFSFSVTLSQLSDSNMGSTYAEMIRIARQVIVGMPEYQGGAVRLRQDFNGFRGSVRGALGGHRDLLHYMDTH